MSRDGAGDAGAAATAAPEARLQWIGWDGSRLAWRVALDTPAALELRLDGVAFQRWPDCVGEREFSVAFEISPSGNAALEFSVAAGTGTVGEPWRVHFGRAAHPGQDAWHGATPALRALAGTPRLPPRGIALPPVAVVVPIHNAPASLARCLAALTRWTPASAQLILVDDASTEPAIAGLLEHCARAHGARVMRNADNRGYTHSVNTGIACAGTADVVLLNSDAEVGPHWLPALQVAASADPTIGTATAVSDNAGAFSVPELEQYCPIPPNWDVVTAQRALLQQAGLLQPQLPTGNGFCMYVKRALFDRIGVFDAQAFASGYGEENDFCQRAAAAGWRSVIAGNVLVRHERSASFGDARRAELGRRGMAVLRERYPGYERDIDAQLYSFARRVLDWRVRSTWAGAERGAAPRRRLLLVARGGDEAHAAAARIGRGCEVFALHGGAAPRLFDGAGNLLAAFAADPLAGEAAALRAWLVAQAIEDVVAAPDLPLAAAVAGIAAELGIATWRDVAAFCAAAARACPVCAGR